MSDENIWRSIGGKNHCAFKMPQEDGNLLCKNKNNLTGFCDRFSCPLANSRYATVREIGEELYLFIKEPERIHIPKDAYEKIKLSSNYEEAVRQIEENLEFWDPKVIHKCKQRHTKLLQYLQRLEYFKEHGRENYMVRKKKMNRREKLRALRSLDKINFERDIGEELMMRLEDGIYGTELKDRYHIAHAAHLEREKEKSRKKRYVAEFEESDGEDMETKETEAKARKKKKETIKW
jgi:protein MAK16